MKIKFILRNADFYLYKTEDGYAVKDQFGYNLKTAKTLQTCKNYIQKQLDTRRAAERYAIEQINREHNKNRPI
jgi:hypothetical protein